MPLNTGLQRDEWEEQLHADGSETHERNRVSTTVSGPSSDYFESLIVDESVPKDQTFLQSTQVEQRIAMHDKSGSVPTCEPGPDAWSGPDHGSGKIHCKQGAAPSSRGPDSSRTSAPQYKQKMRVAPRLLQHHGRSRLPADQM